MNPQPQRLAYTVGECAAALRVSKRTIRRAIAAGKLQALRLGRLVRVSSQSLQEFVQSAGQVGPAWNHDMELTDCAERKNRARDPQR